MAAKINQQLTGKREDSDRPVLFLNSSEPFRILLLLAAAFFISWGPGLQKVVPIYLYKIFPFLAGSLVIYWLILGRSRMGAFPLPYNLFFFFALIHTFVCYIFFHPGEFVFRYTGVLYSQDDFVLMGLTRGLTVARYFLFFLFAYALSSLLKDKHEFSLFSCAYGLGYVTALLLGGHETIDATQGFIRATGGFLNPNSMAVAGLVCCFLNLAIFLGNETTPRRKAISLLFILAGIYGIQAAVSRSTLTAFACGGMVVIIYLPLARKVRLIVSMAFIFFIVASLLLPGAILQTITKRVTTKNIKESHWSMRRDIWGDYIRERGHYMFTGLGLGRSVEAIKDTYTTDSSKPLIPHQTYIQVLVEYGIVGFILFLAALSALAKRGYQLASSRPEGIENAVMLGFLVALIVFGFISSILVDRTVWMSLGIIAFVQTRNKIPIPNGWNLKRGQLRARLR